jgi:hypothetical protein
MIEGQSEEAVWMPYYTMRLTVISSFKAKIVVPVEATADTSAVPRRLHSPTGWEAIVIGG